MTASLSQVLTTAWTCRISDSRVQGGGGATEGPTKVNIKINSIQLILHDFAFIFNDKNNRLGNIMLASWRQFEFTLLICSCGLSLHPGEKIKEN